MTFVVCFFIPDFILLFLWIYGRSSLTSSFKLDFLTAPVSRSVANHTIRDTTMWKKEIKDTTGKSKYNRKQHSNKYRY